MMNTGQSKEGVVFPHLDLHCCAASKRAQARRDHHWAVGAMLQTADGQHEGNDPPTDRRRDAKIPFLPFEATLLVVTVPNQRPQLVWEAP